MLGVLSVIDVSITARKTIDKYSNGPREETEKWRERISDSTRCNNMATHSTDGGEWGEARRTYMLQSLPLQEH